MWQKRRRTLRCTKLAGDENQGPEQTQPPHDDERTTGFKPLHKAPSTHSALGDARRTERAVFVSSSDEEKESAGRARVLQRRGRARVRELVKMAECMPEEAERPSALETKSVPRKTLEVHAAFVREFCDWSGLLPDSNVEALVVDRLLTESMNLLFSEGHRAWKDVSTFSPLEGNRLARSFRALEAWRKTSPSLDHRSRQQSGALRPWKCAGSVARWRVCSPWSCSKHISDQKKCCHSNLRVSWHRRRVASEAG